MAEQLPSSVDDLATSLRDHAYLADRGLATVLHLSIVLEKPLLLEGEAGVGKTELAKVLAELSGARLIRLQCYEGIDVAHALYDWSYSRQLLYIRTLEAGSAQDARETLHELFSREFLERRPLLDAIEHDDAIPPVLLIDEIDRADDEFEAFLLEVLSDYAVTIPELGTVRAQTPPLVIVTSNRTRDVHDALKRRCLYHWLDHPARAREVAILRRRVPDLSPRLAEQVAYGAARLRGLGLVKPPGLAESLDWARSLQVLGAGEVTAETAAASLGAVVKYREDVETVTSQGLQHLLQE